MAQAEEDGRAGNDLGLLDTFARSARLTGNHGDGSARLMMINVLG